jgi:tetratricopeptide (TPR) repeat protein
MSIFDLRKKQEDGDDVNIEADLRAQPISTDRMKLLWFDPAVLGLLAPNSSGNETGVFTVGATVHEMKPSAGDIEWAKKVNVFAVRAAEASKRDDYAEAIKWYRQALDLAPGCDLYLMSIGCCYASSGQVKTGLRYLQRAHEINPSNQRIQRNLDGVRSMVR